MSSFVKLRAAEQAAIRTRTARVRRAFLMERDKHLFLQVRLRACAVHVHKEPVQRAREEMKSKFLFAVLWVASSEQQLYGRLERAKNHLAAVLKAHAENA